MTKSEKAYDGKFDMIQTVAGVTPEYPFVVSDRPVPRLMAGPAPVSLISRHPAPDQAVLTILRASCLRLLITLQNHINNWSVAESAQRRDTRDMLQCDNNNKRQPDTHDTDSEEDIELEDGDRQCTQPKVY